MIGASLVAVAWGTFAFGAVYEWAYVPLAIACALIGLAGLIRGHVPLQRLGLLVLGLAAIALVGALQLVPLPPDLLKSISPGSDRFLRAYHFGYALAVNGPSGAEVDAGPARFAISVAPRQTMLA
ncbi:MAG: hypothetical protein ABL961_17570, partial [Vicinamibacterales bacterium]